MRSITLVAGLAVLALAACGQDGEGTPAGKNAAANAAGTGMPAGPKPGLWRVTTRFSGMPAGMEAPTVETCVREAKFEVPQGAQEASGMTCEQQSFRREGDAMVGHMVCTSADGGSMPAGMPPIRVVTRHRPGMGPAGISAADVSAACGALSAGAPSFP